MLSEPGCCVTVTTAPAPDQPATLVWAPAPPGAALPGRVGRVRSSGGGAGGGPCDPEHCVQHLLRLLATSLLGCDEGLMEVRVDGAHVHESSGRDPGKRAVVLGRERGLR